MPLALPVPNETPLARSPLALVLCQIRFEEVVGVGDSRVLVNIHGALGAGNGRYPRFEPTRLQTINVQLTEGAVAPVSPQQRSGWRLSSTDGKWTVYLLPDSLSLETTGYTTWEDFKARLLELLDAVMKSPIAPALEHRVGLRYVNRITEPEVSRPAEWQEFIAAPLLGPILDPHIGESVRSSQQQLEIDADEGMQCTFRHGFFADPARDGAPTYLLDYDAYREGWRQFEASSIEETVDQFHHRILQLFQVSLTQSMLHFLRGNV